MLALRLTAVAVALFLAVDADAAPISRRIPDSNLGLPVLITATTGAGTSTGSGFYLTTNAAFYLVTAAHVLFADGDHLIAPAAELLSYGPDPKDSTETRFTLDLVAIQQAGMIVRHEKSDVAVIRLGTKTEAGCGFLSGAGVFPQSMAKSGMSVASRVGGVLTYADVMVANEVIVFGYPTSLGLQQSSHFDHSRPLLRSGIVAGKNDQERTIVLDCPVYPGNSGGPVIGISSEGLGSQTFLIIGVVTQFVPLVEEWVNKMFRYQHMNVGNSGYSIAAPMDFVLELMDRLEKKPAPSGPVAGAPTTGK